MVVVPVAVEESTVKPNPEQTCYNLPDILLFTWFTPVRDLPVARVRALPPPPPPWPLPPTSSFPSPLPDPERRGRQVETGPGIGSCKSVCVVQRIAK